MLLWATYGNEWSLNHPVTFDGVNKRIIVAPSVNTISVKSDLYSNWKEWVQLYDNAKFLPAFRTIGGDPVGGGQLAGDLYFLSNDWQIVIDHPVTLTGILYSDNPALSPYVIQPGGGVIATVSNLAQSIESASAGLTPEQQVQLDVILKYIKTVLALSA